MKPLVIAVATKAMVVVVVITVAISGGGSRNSSSSGGGGGGGSSDHLLLGCDRFLILYADNVSSLQKHLCICIYTHAHIHMVIGETKNILLD